MTFRSVLAASAVLLSLAPAGRAAKVKVWHHYSPAHYEKAQWKHAVISNEGTLRLSRQLKPLSGVNAAHVWDVVEDPQGNLYIATGDEGKLYKMTPDGKVSVAFESAESQILCLALAPDGAVYAGTGPSGLVIRVAPDGNARVIYDSPETYVWSLAVDARGTHVYAGTGPKGRIYEITPRGKATVFYTTKQEHILSLAFAADGSLYAGTDKGGLVYRIDPKGKAFVLYNAPQAEVRSLLVTPEGVYAGTSSPVRRHSGGSSASATGERPSLSEGARALPASATKSEGESDTAKRPARLTSSSSASDEEKKTHGASATAPPAAGENSLYRIQPDGTVREVFREKTLLLSLLRHQGRLFVGTGMDGQLFEIDEATRERSEIARLDHGQIHCLRQRRDGSIILGTGDPGRLYVLHDAYAAKGTVVSDVLDAKIVSKWGALRWRADMPPGTRISVAARSGNVAEPDETWSDWSDEQTDPRQASVAAPPARFLQYRVTLTTENPTVTPALHSLAVRYRTTNQAPEITKLEVPDLDAINRDEPKKLKFKWAATDANEDELTYRLYVRKDGWPDWILLEDDLDKKEFEWDTTTTPAGVYRLRLVASDRPDNPAEEALTGERTSGPFVVAHDPPTVKVKYTGLAGEKAMIEATATDPLVRLTAAAFSINGDKWVNVFPTDGLFDSKTETFRFQTRQLKPGTYVLVLRVTDAAGNIGTGDMVLTVKIDEPPRR